MQKFKLINADTFIMEDGKQVTLVFKKIYQVKSGPFVGVRLRYMGWDGHRSENTYGFDGVKLVFEPLGQSHANFQVSPDELEPVGE